jgi:hypothetical protein
LLVFLIFWSADMKRGTSLQRILKVQDDLRRKAEVKLMALRLREAELQSMEQHILQSLTSQDPREMALASMAGDRLRWLDRDLKENQAAQTEAQEDMRRILMHRLTCARMAKRAQEQERVDDERRALADILDEHQARCASFE